MDSKPCRVSGSGLSISWPLQLRLKINSAIKDRLRRRERQVFTGFTKDEVQKMERLLNESGEEVLNKQFCQTIATRFSRSAGRAGKPVVKWTEVHSWFESMKKGSKKDSKNVAQLPVACALNKQIDVAQFFIEEKIPDLSELEFEARSSKDGAWYDVEMFLAHRFLSNGEAEVRIRYVGFGAEEDEWVNIKESVRERSIPLENSECHKVKVGDHVLCFQERRDQASYHDAHVLEVQRRMHDIRGCRCRFLIQYDQDGSEESVNVKRLCRRPT